MGKTRPVDRPYAVYVSDDGWTWKVLKAYSADPHVDYARWMCAVSSPYTQGSYDLGDTYVADVLQYGRLAYRDPDVPRDELPVGDSAAALEAYGELMERRDRGLGWKD
jgi:hypothetical protein